jgi:hypothetical protein
MPTFLAIGKEIQSWKRDEFKYGFDYFTNIARIIANQKPINYEVISHNNKLINSFLYSADNSIISPTNLLVRSYI